MSTLPLPKITVGLLLYHSQKYLKGCFDTLLAQDYPNFEITVLDNTNGTSSDAAFIQTNYPAILLYKAANLGFSGGHNFLIRKSIAPFYACLNVDMVFEPTFLSALMDALLKDDQFAIAAPKLLRFDFARQTKTRQIDTVGLRFYRSHRFEDEGQGSLDVGQYDQEKEIFGCSGAAFLARRDAFNDISFFSPEGAKTSSRLQVKKIPEYFDELMFMYKEDIDLMYRLRWAGWKVGYTPKALAYHDRTIENTSGKSHLAIVKNRRHKSAQIREWSYLHHQILLYKNRSPQFSWRTKIAIAWYQAKLLIYIFFFERYLLRQRKVLRMLDPLIADRSRDMPRRVDPCQIEKWMV